MLYQAFSDALRKEKSYGRLQLCSSYTLHHTGLPLPFRDWLRKSKGLTVDTTTVKYNHNRTHLRHWLIGKYILQQSRDDSAHLRPMGC